MEKIILKVKTNTEKPDFRVFNAFFFGDDFHNTDSEGDSQEVWDRHWTELYKRSRENASKWLDISPSAYGDKTILEVSAGEESEVYALAYFLAQETQGEVFNANDVPLSVEELTQKMGDFPLQERLALAQKSIWRLSCKENPYPNVKD